VTVSTWLAKDASGSAGCASAPMAEAAARVLRRPRGASAKPGLASGGADADGLARRRGLQAAWVSGAAQLALNVKRPRLSRATPAPPALHSLTHAPAAPMGHVWNPCVQISPPPQQRPVSGTALCTSQGAAGCTSALLPECQHTGIIMTA